MRIPFYIGVNFMTDATVANQSMDETIARANDTVLKHISDL